jgi:hypothetical protein
MRSLARRASIWDPYQHAAPASESFGHRIAEPDRTHSLARRAGKAKKQLVVGFHLI